MLELKTKKELAKYSHNLARGFNLVRFRNTTYLPVDFETGEWENPPDEERTMWVPMNREAIRQAAATRFDTLFANDAELKSFDFMVAQNSQQHDGWVKSLLVRTPDGLRVLNGKGTLEEVTGEFIPNTLTPMLNEDVKAKAAVFEEIVEWVDTEEEAHSLLHHLATALSPGWSAVKYVLLLGEGRNGKSVLMKMLSDVFGQDNVSNVTRQQISEQSPVVAELNGKLLNIIYDGRAEYLKDSGTEKSLIAGEPAPIRLLYESTPTMVSTNALFIEGLNREPKSHDKSSALQKRLVRFQFPNVYPLNHKFERRMRSPEMLGAFLSVLIDHYVHEDKVAELLAPTQKAVELQLEHMYINSLALQFLKHLEEVDALGATAILGHPVSELVQQFQSWRLKENDLGTWAEPDVIALFNPLLVTERRSVREGGKVKKVRVATALKQEASAFIESLKGEHDDADAELIATLVED